MSKFLSAVKRLLILAVIIGAGLTTGCLTTTANLNHAITNTECQTFEECAKALALDSQPENPDLVFVIEPYPFEKPFLNGWGVRMIFTEMRTGNAELCMAKALREEFNNVAIVLKPEELDKYKTKPTILIKIKDLEVGGNLKYSSYCKLKIVVAVNGKETEINGFGSIGILRVINSGKVYYFACQDIAKQVKTLLTQPISTENKAGV